MDYEVFLRARVREELTRHGDASRAAVDAVARTARVITVAAAILGAFALSPEFFVKLIGIGLATAIIVDATIVRMVLVPAVMQLLGGRTWWLSHWLDRLLPRIRIDARSLASASALERRARRVSHAAGADGPPSASTKPVENVRIHEQGGPGVLVP
jgi:RND superfamily putative drug exporter